MKNLYRVGLLLVGALSSSVTLALGLGEAKLQSTLGQPLRVEIAIIDSSELEPEDILVKQVLGSRSSDLNQSVRYKFKVERDEAGQLIVIASSKGSINEPFVSFLLSVQLPNGAITREYTLILDL